MFPCKFEVERKQPLARPGNQSENAPMKIGYARVSTGDQNPELQITALKREGCERIASVLPNPHDLGVTLQLGKHFLAQTGGDLRVNARVLNILVA